ncbi:AN1-type zinc finger protein 2B [Nymphon striatum]|nr:AN1-type zinc finger protein 2B [Nymphon striatum]
MEFPDLGKHCSVTLCKQLDFLPVQCDCCNEIFCLEHFSYSKHNCSKAYTKDVQVPICPLCSKPIPVKKGETPDIPMNNHIETQCQSDPAKANRKKIYTNSCSVKRCKQRELIKVSCTTCHQNFCLKHRLPEDHQCTGPPPKNVPSTSAGSAALSRLFKSQGTNSSSRNCWSNSTAQNNHTKISQPQTSADADLARAMQLSLQTNNNSAQRVQGQHNNDIAEDENLARAIQMSLQENSNRSQSHNQQNSNRKNVSIKNMTIC